MPVGNDRFWPFYTVSARPNNVDSSLQYLRHSARLTIGVRLILSLNWPRIVVSISERNGTVSARRCHHPFEHCDSPPIVICCQIVAMSSYKAFWVDRMLKLKTRRFRALPDVIRKKGLICSFWARARVLLLAAAADQQGRERKRQPETLNRRYQIQLASHVIHRSKYEVRRRSRSAAFGRKFKRPTSQKFSNLQTRSNALMQFREHTP